VEAADLGRGSLSSTWSGLDTAASGSYIIPLRSLGLSERASTLSNYEGTKCQLPVVPNSQAAALVVFARGYGSPLQAHKGKAASRNSVHPDVLTPSPHFYLELKSRERISGLESALSPLSSPGGFLSFCNP
jgi:hypothetical protein